MRGIFKEIFKIKMKFQKDSVQEVVIAPFKSLDMLKKTPVFFKCKRNIVNTCMHLCLSDKLYP